MRQMMSVMIAVGALSSAASAGMYSQMINFNEMPLNSELHGTTIGRVGISFMPATPKTTAPFFAEVPINGGNFGATDNFVARGTPDGVSTIRMSFDNFRLEALAFGISTVPFSPAPFTLTIGLVNEAGVVFEENDYTTDILVRLANNLPLLRYGQYLVDYSGRAEEIRAIDLTFTGNADWWLLDKMGFGGYEIPAPGAAMVVGCGALVMGVRRRR